MGREIEGNAIFYEWLVPVISPRIVHQLSRYQESGVLHVTHNKRHRLHLDNSNVFGVCLLVIWTPYHNSYIQLIVKCPSKGMMLFFSMQPMLLIMVLLLMLFLVMQLELLWQDL